MHSSEILADDSQRKELSAGKDCNDRREKRKAGTPPPAIK
jgi:hypothetical protein